MTRTTCLYPLPKDDPSAKRGKCNNCGTVVFFRSPRFENLRELACSRECELALQWFVPTEYIPPQQRNKIANQKKKREKEKSEPKPKVIREPCPDCGGPPAKRRGWIHKTTCPRLPQNKPKNRKPPCSECGGPARGRGWSHKPNCSRKTSTTNEEFDETTYEQIKSIDPQAAEDWKKSKIK